MTLFHLFSALLSLTLQLCLVECMPAPFGAITQTSSLQLQLNNTNSLRQALNLNMTATHRDEVRYQIQDSNIILIIIPEADSPITPGNALSCMQDAVTYAKSPDHQHSELRGVWWWTSHNVRLGLTQTIYPTAGLDLNWADVAVIANGLIQYFSLTSQWQDLNFFIEDTEGGALVNELLHRSNGPKQEGQNTLTAVKGDYTPCEERECCICETPTSRILPRAAAEDVQQGSSNDTVLGPYDGILDLPLRLNLTASAEEKSMELYPLKKALELFGINRRTRQPMVIEALQGADTIMTNRLPPGRQNAHITGLSGTYKVPQKVKIGTGINKSIFPPRTDMPWEIRWDYSDKDTDTGPHVNAQFGRIRPSKFGIFLDPSRFLPIGALASRYKQGTFNKIAQDLNRVVNYPMTINYGKVTDPHYPERVYPCFTIHEDNEEKREQSMIDAREALKRYFIAVAEGRAAEGPDDIDMG